MIEFITLMVLMLSSVSYTPTQAEQLAMQTIDAARSNGEDPILYASLIAEESHWDPRAKSAMGAYGLPQLHPAYYPGRRTTWEQLWTGATILAQYREKCRGTAGTIAAYRSGRCELRSGPATQRVLKLYWKWRVRHKAFVRERTRARLVAWPTSASGSPSPSKTP